nr:MAG TPA: integrase [Caudoviricetes sp.]
MNAALYIRVSTDDQVEYSPDAQQRLLLDYAKKNNWDVNEEHIFIDGGISGRKAEKRPEFMKMIGLAKSKEKPFQKILVWKFSRFARNQEESIVYKNMLRKDGVDVISVSEPIIEGPFGSLIERIIEWMDEYYSIRLSGEVMRGMTQKAITDGVPASPPFGYRLKDKKYVIEEDEAKIVRYIFDEVCHKTPLTAICRSLLEMGVRGKGGGRWHTKRIRYMVNNPAYIGSLRWNYSTHQNGRVVNNEDDWIIKENTHEPIVSKEKFEIAKSLVNDFPRSKRPVSLEIKHYLAGLLRCSECGGTLVFNSAKRQKGGFRLSYRCNQYNKGACNTSNYIRVEDAESKVKDRLKQDYTLICAHKGSIKVISKSSSTDERVILEKRLEKVSSKYTKAKEAYLAGIDSIDEYKKNKEDILKEENALKDKLSKLNTSSPEESIAPKMLHAINILDDDSISPEVKNKVLKEFIDKIVVDKSIGVLDFFYYNKM